MRKNCLYLCLHCSAERLLSLPCFSSSVRTMWDPLLGSSFVDDYFLTRDYCLDQQWSRVRGSATNISKHPWFSGSVSSTRQEGLWTLNEQETSKILNMGPYKLWKISANPNSSVHIWPLGLLYPDLYLYTSNFKMLSSGSPPTLVLPSESVYQVLQFI